MTIAHHRTAGRAERLAGTLIAWLVDRGVNLAGAQTLTVRGRTSGEPRRAPVNPIVVGDAEYLVAPRGNTQWSRNARVNPDAQLRRGRRVREVRLHEVTDADVKTTVIADYLRRWGWEVGRLLPAGLTPDADTAVIRRYLDELPVFEVR